MGAWTVSFFIPSKTWLCSGPQIYIMAQLALQLWEKICSSTVPWLGRYVGLSDTLVLTSQLWLWSLHCWVYVLWKCTFHRKIPLLSVCIDFVIIQFKIVLLHSFKELCEGNIMVSFIFLVTYYHYVISNNHEISRLRNIVSNFLWNMSPTTVAPNGMTVNLNWLISVLKVVKKLDSSSNGWCQYSLEQSNTMMTVAPGSLLCNILRGVEAIWFRDYGFVEVGLV